MKIVSLIVGLAIIPALANAKTLAQEYDRHDIARRINALKKQRAEMYQEKIDVAKQILGAQVTKVEAGGSVCSHADGSIDVYVAPNGSGLIAKLTDGRICHINICGGQAVADVGEPAVNCY